MKALHELMKKEVDLMREILSLMVQEEQALLRGDKEGRKEILDKRFLLKRKLLPIKRKRNEMMKSLNGEIPAEEKISQIELEKISFSHFGEDEYDLVALRDQILFLSKKIEDQKHSNRLLNKQFKNRAFPQKNLLQEKVKPESKPRLKTIEVEEEKSL